MNKPQRIIASILVLPPLIFGLFILINTGKDLFGNWDFFVKYYLISFIVAVVIVAFTVYTILYILNFILVGKSGDYLIIGIIISYLLSIFILFQMVNAVSN